MHRLSEAVDNASTELAIVMDPIEKNISDVFAAFRREDDPDLLYVALNEVEDVQRYAKPEDRNACRRGISLLLIFMAALDQHIDPKWNPKNVPLTRVPPPEPYISTTLDGEIDPAEITDPGLRARYEQQLRTNREEVKRYRIQSQLRSLEERAIDDLKLFAERCFTGSSADRRDFQALLDTASLSDARKRSVRKAVRLRLWPFGN